jgi:hypothetical protein
MATEKKLIYADSGKIAAEYMKKHLVHSDSDFLRGYLTGVEALATGLAKLPPVYAVEVVRCKDCVHYENEICWNPSSLLLASHDSFCSYGERRS